jgi:hypothetical protein
MPLHTKQDETHAEAGDASALSNIEAKKAAAGAGPARSKSYGQRHTFQQQQRALQAAAAAAGSPRKQQGSLAAGKLSSSDMDEILGVMDALGPCRKAAAPAGDDAVAAAAQPSTPASEQQDSCTAADDNKPSSSIKSGESQQPRKQQQQQQEEQAHVEEQHSPGVSPRGSTPLGRPTRASMLSSKVPAGKGPVVSVKPAVFSFDAAHPGLADKHYLRTKEQDRCGPWLGCARLLLMQVVWLAVAITSLHKLPWHCTMLWLHIVRCCFDSSSKAFI